MKPVTVKVEGLKEVDAALKELSEQVGNSRAGRAVARKALTAGGEILARAMRRHAPKRDMNLSESVEVSTRLTRRQRSLHRKLDPVEVFVGPNDPAAIPQEFGTFKEPPQPFARPAWDETRDQVLKRVSDELMVGVARASQRAAAKAAKGA